MTIYACCKRMFSSVSCVSDVCFKCFIWVLQKVDRDVAYTCLLQEYIFKRFKCFICMLQVFHLDIAYVLQWLHTCFSSVSDVSCKCFQTYVVSVSSGCCKSRSSVAHVAMEPIGHSHLLQMLGDV